MKETTYLIAVVLWLAGIVLAKGFGAFIAVIFPLYAWYLVIERLMNFSLFYMCQNFTGF